MHHQGIIRKHVVEESKDNKVAASQSRFLLYRLMCPFVHLISIATVHTQLPSFSPCIPIDSLRFAVVVN